MKPTRSIALLVVIASSLSAFQLAPLATKPFDFVKGCWVVTGSYFTGPPVALSQGQVDHLAGSTVCFGRTSIRFGSHTLSHPNYSVRIYTPAEFEQEFRVRCSEIDACAETITEIDAVNPGQPGSDFPAAIVIWLDRDHLAALDQGVFLKLARNQHHP